MMKSKISDSRIRAATATPAAMISTGSPDGAAGSTAAAADDCGDAGVRW